MVKHNADKKRLRRTLLHPTTQMLMALVLFIVSAILVSDGELAAWEKALFHAIYDLPDMFSPLFFIITQFGGVIALFLLSALFLMLKRYQIIIRMLMAGLLAEFLAHAAKSTVGRPRPGKYFTELILRDPFVGGPGFPSGHTAVATAIALVAAYYLPRRWLWVVPVWIVAVGLSRIYLGVHAPMDLVGGFAIGWFCVSLFRHVQLRDIRRTPA